jgi:hypothetical protein
MGRRRRGGMGGEGMEGKEGEGMGRRKGGMGMGGGGGGMSYLFALSCQLSEKMRQKIWHQQNTPPPNSPLHIHIHIDVSCKNLEERMEQEVQEKKMNKKRVSRFLLTF